MMEAPVGDTRSVVTDTTDRGMNLLNTLDFSAIEEMDPSTGNAPTHQQRVVPARMTCLDVWLACVGVYLSHSVCLSV